MGSDIRWQMLDSIFSHIEKKKGVREFEKELGWDFFDAIVLERKFFEIDKLTNFERELFKKV